MIYDLKNSIEAGNALSYLLKPCEGMSGTEIKKMLEEDSFGDYDCLIGELNRALRESVCVEIVEDTPYNATKGRLISATLDIDDNNIHACTLNLELDLEPCGGIGNKKYNCTFDPYIVERNEHSNGRHTKIYLWLSKGLLSISIIFYYG